MAICTITVKTMPLFKVYTYTALGCMLICRRLNQEEVGHCQQRKAKRAHTIGRINKGAAVLAIQHIPQLVNEVRQAGVQRACMAPRTITKSLCSNLKR